MSTNDPIDLKQDRRQWLKTSASILGAAALPLAAIAAEIPQAKTDAATAPPVGQEHTSAAHFFTPAEHALVDELTETIIPADSHSGGAKAAKVVDTIDKFLREDYDDSKRTLWREGLRLIDVMSQHYCGKTFVNASPEERIAVLTVLSEHTKATDLTEVKFFNDLKEMTVLCYYTSKIGIHDELEYKGNRILQEYVGCDDQGPASK
jgi:hypothetical protein